MSSLRTSFICLAALLLPSLSQAQSPTPSTRSLTLTLTDGSSNHPLANAQVSFHIDDAKPTNLTTTDQGAVSIPLPAKDPDYLSITATASHHVPTSLTYRNDSENPKQPIPSSFTLPLEPGTSLGGIIQDPDGKPIAGATVYLLVPNSHPGNIRPAIWDFPVKTDAAGHWHTALMPADLPDIWIRLKHPDFASDTMYGQTPKPPMEKLRDETGVMILRRGITVAGRVTDSAGKPIPGATVAQGSDRWGSHYPSTKTDADGNYSFKNVSAGDLVLTVQCKGFSPDLKTLSIQNNQPSVDFQLDPGRILKGHVVDSDGKPIPNATITADTWRGHRSINWMRHTDASGAFTWENAPGDAVLFNAFADGYAYNRTVTLTAAAPEVNATVDNKVVLAKPTAVHITVTDADTHQPVTRYNLINGIAWGNGQPLYWERREHSSSNHPAGKMDFNVFEPRPGHAVRIEADGYAPLDSRIFTDNEGPITLNLELHKAANLTATVLTPDGKPAANATAGLAILPYGIRVENGRIAEQQDQPVTHTDAAGKLSFPAQNPPYKLVLTHDTGFAILTPDQISSGKPITLEPWAHVTGTLKIGPNPAAGQIVSGWYGGEALQFHPNQPNVMLSIQSTTDSAGRFSFDRVPPGELHLGRQVKLSDRMTGYSHAVPLDLKPGDSATANIGGAGRPVVGRVDIPADLIARGNWTPAHAGLESNVVLPKPNLPDKVAAMTPEEKKKWYEKWQNSPEGKAFVQAQQKTFLERKSFPFALNSDGTFRIDDVPAGSYKLSVTLADAPPANKCGFGDELATGSLDVTVPEMPTGRSDQPLELPTLSLAPIKHLNVGDTAPDFSVKTLDGHTLKLSDFKGKYVLLDFWATWCGPCAAEIPNLKAVHAALSNNPNFTIVSLSLDPDTSAPLKFTQQNQMIWPQGFLGDWSTATLPNIYGIRSVPSTFLISPTGKILAKDLRGPTLPTQLATFVNNRP